MFIDAFLSKNYPYTFLEAPPVAIQPAPSSYPTTLAARAFKSTEIMNLPRASLQETELTHRPELLQDRKSVV